MKFFKIEIKVCTGCCDTGNVLVTCSDQAVQILLDILDCK